MFHARLLHCGYDVMLPDDRRREKSLLLGCTRYIYIIQSLEPTWLAQARPNYFDRYVNTYGLREYRVHLSYHALIRDSKITLQVRVC